MRQIFPLVAGLLLLAACAAHGPGPAAPDPTRAQVTTQDVPTTQAALESRLRELGFMLEPDSEPGMIRAGILTEAPADWFLCDKVRVEDSSGDSNRSRLVDPEDHKVLVQIRVTSLGNQTNVDMKTHYYGVYRDRFDNNLFDQNCVASGALEQAVFAVVTPSPTA